MLPQFVPFHNDLPAIQVRSMERSDGFLCLRWCAEGNEGAVPGHPVSTAKHLGLHDSAAGGEVCLEVSFVRGNVQPRYKCIKVAMEVLWSAISRLHIRDI